MANKYDIALSFAGEDREYVQGVASALQAAGVKVFYDAFEEADLWGKDLFSHLSEVYNNAIYTVIFISEAYVRKQWTSHERKIAQARAFTDSKEYILPAFFDEKIDVPGLLSTTGHVSLVNKTPAQLATLIIKKLKGKGVILSQQFAYSEKAKADVDFASSTSLVKQTLKALKTLTWGVQNPAVVNLMKADWSKFTSDEAFVLGRNLYQCACGNEHKAMDVVSNLRRELAQLPDNRAHDVVNGMFYEVYFNPEGEFRGKALKVKCFEGLLKLQTVPRFEPTIAFIRRALEPYSKNLLFRPNSTPEQVRVDVYIRKSDPPVIKSMLVAGKEVLVNGPPPDDRGANLWRLSHQEFTIRGLSQHLSEEWGVPIEQLDVQSSPRLDSKVKLRLPNGFFIVSPTGG